MRSTVANDAAPGTAGTGRPHPPDRRESSGFLRQPCTDPHGFETQTRDDAPPHEPNPDVPRPLTRLAAPRSTHLKLPTRRPLIVTALAIALTTGLAACSAASPAPSRERAALPTPKVIAGSVWVANEEGNSLAVLDAAANKVVTTLTGIAAPHNVQASRDGSLTYAVSEHDNTVVAVDTTTYAVSAVGPSGPSPAHVIQSADGTKAYVTNSGNGTVSVFRVPGLKSIATIKVGGMPHGLRPAGNGSVVVVANTQANALDVINPATDTETAAVPVGGSPVQVAVDGAGRYAYASITEPASVVKVDLRSRTVVDKVNVPSAPVQLFLTPDGKTLLSADQGTTTKPGNTLSVIDPTTMGVTGTVRTGSGPHGVVVDPSGTRAWVTNVDDDTVSVVDIAGLAVLATIPVGDMPNGVTFFRRPPAPAAAPTIDLNLRTSRTPDDDHTSMTMPMPDEG